MFVGVRLPKLPNNRRDPAVYHIFRVVDIKEPGAYQRKLHQRNRSTSIDVIQAIERPIKRPSVIQEVALRSVNSLHVDPPGGNEIMHRIDGFSAK